IGFGPGFTQVEMQLHPLLRSQNGRGAHQFGSCRAQGAWGNKYLAKRARPHVMETLYELGRVGQDSICVFDQGLRGKAAMVPANVLTAPAQKEADTQLGCGLEQGGGGHSAWPQIV